jgi:DNA helicase-2/ATP-dependent DNA helicase PcrA
MIEQGINPSNIAMLTFTNKAAHEMKERLATLLTEEQAKDVTACTFHSFCALMLRFHGHHIGISQHFTILSPGEDTDIISIVKG